jgi:hypothetical protein
MKSVAGARATIPHSKKPFEKKETKLLEPPGPPTRRTKRRSEED